MLRSRKLLPLWLVLGLLLAYLPARLTAQTPNRAALVVRFGDAGVVTQCVEFSEEQISGYDLLVRSGLEVIADFQGMGALVCSIDGTGCPAANCLCQCQGGGTCIYWSYWHRVEGNWRYSPGGASMYPVTDGVVEGWSWGPGSVSEAIPPPDLDFEDVCSTAATPTSEPTQTPTRVPPTPTWTPTSSPAADPQISFTVDDDVIPAGSCTTLRWQVANVSAVFLDGAGVSGVDTREVCPAQTATYTLRVEYPGGEESRTLTVTVEFPTATATATTADVPNDVTAPATPIPPTGTPTTDVATIPPPPTSSSTVVAAAPTAQASPTEEVVWITVPPLPTVRATPAEVAVVPTATVEQPNEESATVDRPEEDTPWVPYVAFLAMVLLLASLIAWTRLRTESR